MSPCKVAIAICIICVVRLGICEEEEEEEEEQFHAPECELANSRLRGKQVLEPYQGCEIGMFYWYYPQGEETLSFPASSIFPESPSGQKIKACVKLPSDSGITAKQRKDGTTEILQPGSDEWTCSDPARRVTLILKAGLYGFNMEIIEYKVEKA